MQHLECCAALILAGAGGATPTTSSRGATKDTDRGPDTSRAGPGPRAWIPAPVRAQNIGPGCRSKAGQRGEGARVTRRCCWSAAAWALRARAPTSLIAERAFAAERSPAGVGGRGATRAGSGSMGRPPREARGVCARKADAGSGGRSPGRPECTELLPRPSFRPGLPLRHGRGCFDMRRIEGPHRRQLKIRSHGVLVRG